ncbi:MAG: class I adenylate-forming enzyme family protein [Chthoniobacterales bacterium]
MNIVEEIFSRHTANRSALITDTQILNFAELNERSAALAAELRSLRDVRVCLDCPDGVEHVVLALGILRAGKCLVALAPELTEREREELIFSTQPTLLLDREGRKHRLNQVEEPNFSETDFAKLGAAFIRFSSGTTGKSKGVVLSHETLLERINAANRGLQISASDRIVWTLPMAHHFAVSIMLYLFNGAATLLPKSHLAKDVLSMAQKHFGTIFYASPFHHALLAADKSGLEVPSLRLAISTASELPVATARKFLNRFGIPLSQGLGIIEVGLSCINLTAAKNKPTSIGRALPDYEIDLRGGELWIRGPGFFDAYLSPFKKRSEILQDGWFQTGDLAHVDEEGELFLDGRSHSVINVAGMKCFPEEIERVLLEVPGVRWARVFGQSHPRVGTIPIAEIVPDKAGAPPLVKDLVAHCRRSLSSYKIPIDFRFVAELPMTPSGKLKRL